MRPLFLATLALLVAASCTPATQAFLAERGQTASLAQPAVAAPDTEEERVAGVPPDAAPLSEPPPALPSRSEPAPLPDEPEPPPPPLGDLDPVEARPPGVRLDGLSGVDQATVDDALAVAGVSAALGASRARAQVERADGEIVEVSVAAVDVQAVRALVPQITADADEVWHRLHEGDLLVDQAALSALDVELADRISLSGHAERRVGAVAATGEPPLADVLLSIETGEELGMPEPNALLAAVDVDGGAVPSEVATALQERLGGRAVALVADPVPFLDIVDEDIWEALAWCESSGDWHINTGNGYYGGLQFLPESWRWVGGSGMPHEASREEQIYRAELLLQRQGWEAWPACSKALGLR